MIKYNKKVDIFTRGLKPHNGWVYECSTNWSNTCKSAKQAFIMKHDLDSSQVKAIFNRKGKHNA